jgi:predicted DNA-binding transcriptional regulator YafY
MGRASDAQKAERLNRARTLLRDCDQLPDAVEQLAQDCSISPRQAYRYLQQAQRLKEPLTVSESKLAFTVKLPPSLIQRVRLYASVKNLSISEVVSRALLALLPRGRGRG